MVVNKELLSNTNTLQVMMLTFNLEPDDLVDLPSDDAAATVVVVLLAVEVIVAEEV